MDLYKTSSFLDQVQAHSVSGMPKRQSWEAEVNQKPWTWSVRHIIDCEAIIHTVLIEGRTVAPTRWTLMPMDAILRATAFWFIILASPTVPAILNSQTCSYDMTVNKHTPLLSVCCASRTSSLFFAEENGQAVFFIGTCGHACCLEWAFVFASMSACDQMHDKSFHDPGMLRSKQMFMQAKP